MRCFSRLRLFCLLFAAVIAPPAVDGVAAELKRPELTKLPFAIHKGMENTPLVYKGRPILLMNRRDDAKVNTDGYAKTFNSYIIDLQTGQKSEPFAEGFSFVNGIVEGDRLHVFATEGTDREWFQSIYHFWSDDLKTWQRELAIEKRPGENLFNSSVCRDEQGYLMAYETNQPVQFCFRFARSKDLSKWEEVPGLSFRGEQNEYSACPCIRYAAPYYYVIYLHAAVEGHNGWVSYIARSKDLADWELSPMNPILEAGAGEGHNNSDVDLIELDGKTYLTYATGDQQSWCSVRMAMHPGTMREFCEGWFPEGTARPRVDARLEPAAAVDVGAGQ